MRERHESVFAELAAAHLDELTLDIDVTDAQAAHLPGAEPEAVTQREDRVIHVASSGSS